MQGPTISRQTTTWFTTKNTPATPNTIQYKLTGSYSMSQSESPKHAVVDAIVDVTEPAGGQTTLVLYEHVDPDALNELIKASTDKQSHVEVRFMFEQHFVVVRSTGTILVYEPL